MQRTTMDLWVGLFVITGIAALMVLSLKVGNLNVYNPSQSYVITGNFENIGGIESSRAGKRRGRCGRACNRYSVQYENMMRLLP